MALRTDDALTHWASDHRPLAGGAFGLVTAVIVGVAAAIGGGFWPGTAIIALGSGLFVGLIIAAVSGAVSGTVSRGRAPTSSRPAQRRPL